MRSVIPGGWFTRIADIEEELTPTSAGRHVEGPDLVSLFTSCDRTTTAGTRGAALLAVLRVAGLRRAELAALELENLDRATWTLHVLGSGAGRAAPPPSSRAVRRAPPRYSARIARRGGSGGGWKGGASLPRTQRRSS